MAFSFPLNQADLIKALRQIADEAEAGTAVLEEMTISADIAEDAPKDGWETYRLTGRKTMQMSWWAKTVPPRRTTIDGDEYPMLPSDASTEEYIERILREMGCSWTYQSHETVWRPGRAPLLKVQGV